MQITNYTLKLNPEEMFDLAYALEHYIDNSLHFTKGDKKNDFTFNHYEQEVETLQSFVSNFGYKLDVNKKSEEGHTLWENNGKNYSSAREWFKDLVKQRRKEFDRDNK